MNTLKKNIYIEEKRFHTSRNNSDTNILRHKRMCRNLEWKSHFEIIPLIDSTDLTKGEGHKRERKDDHYKGTEILR